jgi:uncharacterized cupin superfamily protein
MADVSVKHVSDLAFDHGANGQTGVQLRHAGRELGIGSVGVNVIDLDPGCEYAQRAGDEAVFVVMRGSATIRVGIQDLAIEPDMLARIGAGEARTIIAGPDGVTLLALGGSPENANVAATDVNQLH